MMYQLSSVMQKVFDDGCTLVLLLLSEKVIVVTPAQGRSWWSGMPLGHCWHRGAALGGARIQVHQCAGPQQVCILTLLHFAVCIGNHC